MPTTVGRVKCPECQVYVEYHRDDHDKAVVVEASRALALEHHAEEHWPTVVATGTRHLAMRCYVCHGPINRLSSKSGTPWVIVSPCGHREGSDSHITVRPAFGALRLMQSETYTVWIFEPNQEPNQGRGPEHDP